MFLGTNNFFFAASTTEIGSPLFYARACKLTSIGSFGSGGSVDEPSFPDVVVYFGLTPGAGLAAGTFLEAAVVATSFGSTLGLTPVGLAVVTDLMSFAIGLVIFSTLVSSFDD